MQLPSSSKQDKFVLRHMARIGDFREAFLEPLYVTKFGREDHVTSVRQALTALKLCCWLNTLERRLFSAPYQRKDCQSKMDHFLSRFGAVLADPEAAWRDWEEEYKQVEVGFSRCSTEQHRHIGLAVVESAEPLHYYSLFSHTIGFDTVLTMYQGQRYELEAKYTQFVDVHSRRVWPRIDFKPLAQVLNEIEGLQGRSSTRASALAPWQEAGEDGKGATDSMAGRGPGGEVSGRPAMLWIAASFTDTGPILRLEREGTPLSKAQRYGHPQERPIYESSLSPDTFKALVISFLEFGLQGLTPRKGGWSWEHLHDINKAIQWGTWTAMCVQQYSRGELDSGDASLAEQLCVARSLSSESGMLSPLHAKWLTEQLPARFLLGRAWRLAYSTTRDGISFRTLMRCAAGKDATVLIIRDAGGAMFGCFTVESWRIAPRSYGTGESFVFTLRPEMRAYRWQGPNKQAAVPGAPTPQAVSSDFFQFATPDWLAVGPAGHQALLVREDMLSGSSAHCPTFNSPCLAASSDFRIQKLELWQLA